MPKAENDFADVVIENDVKYDASNDGKDDVLEDVDVDVISDNVENDEGNEARNNNKGNDDDDVGGDDGGLGCDVTVVYVSFSSIPEMTSLHPSAAGRKDKIVEELMNVYGVTTYIELPSADVAGTLSIMLQ